MKQQHSLFQPQKDCSSWMESSKSFLLLLFLSVTTIFAVTSKECEAQNGCYSVTGTVVQFQPGDDGQYTPSQILFPVTDSNDVEEDYHLGVNYLALDERDANGNVVLSIAFPNLGYSMVDEMQMINGVSADVVTFSNYLLNGAKVDIIHYFFEQAGTLDFAGNTINVEDGTSKVSVNISGWNFEDAGNTLTLTILLDVSPPPKGSATSTTTGNQTAFSWDTGKTDCVVTIVDVVEVDGGVGFAASNVTSKQIVATLPYFTDYVLYDPGYQVLVKDDKSSSPKDQISPWAYVGAAVGAILVVSVLVAIGYVIISRNNKKIEKALGFKSGHEEAK